jgi:threonine/homoserine/homoserine lactone efflux protein
MDAIPNPLILPLGVLIGIVVALPLGPVNLLGLQRAMERGPIGGLAVGIGIVLGDGLIALATGVGVNALTGVLHAHRGVLQLIGGIALLLTGLRLLAAPPMLVAASVTANERLRTHAWDIPGAFLLTLTSPAAVLGLVALFAGVSAWVDVDSTLEAMLFAAGVMAGGFTYWLVVTRLIGRVRVAITTGWLNRITQIVGWLVVISGAALLADLAATYLF